MQVPADVGHLDQLRRLRNAGLAQLGRDEWQAERREDAFLVGRVRQRLVRGHPLGRAGRADELRSQAVGLGDDQLDRDALDRHAQHPPVAALDHGDNLRQRLEPLQHRRVARNDDGESLRRVAPAAWVARGNAAERLGDRLDERAAAVQQQRTRGRRLWLSRQRRTQLALRLRPDPRHLLQPSRVSCLAQLRKRAHAEHASDLEHPLDRDAEEPSEPGQLRRDLALELLQLGDLTGLDQVEQPPLDPGPDPAQLAGAALPYELGDRRRGRADQVGRAAVGPRRVRLGARQLEQRGELIEPSGDLGVVRR